MRGSVWTGLGVALTMAMIGLSAVINYTFGYSLGTTDTNAHIFGAVSVVAVGVMAVLPLRVSAHWAERRKARATLGAGIFGILAAYAIASSIGFGMQNRSQHSGSRENLNAQLGDDVVDRDRALGRLKGLEAHRPAAAVSAAIAAAKKDRRWDLTQSCTIATAPTSREFCQGIDRLAAELGTAASAAVLSEKIEKLNLSIERLRRQGAGQVADPQSFGFALVLGVGQDLIRAGLSILLALVIESVCCFGLLVIAGGHSGDAQTQEGLTLPEWFGRWLTERAEPQPAARVSFWELEEDFRKWAEARAAPRPSSRKFGRMLREACREIGLTIEGRAVVGLELPPMVTMLRDSREQPR